MKIACVGEAMVELSLDQEGEMAAVRFSGDTLNTAIYLRRALAAEHDISFVSVVGTDQLSSRMLEFIESEGIATDAISRRDDRLPGIYTISTDAAGERSFSYWRENSAARLLFQNSRAIPFEALERYDVVYLSAITLAVLAPEIRKGLFDWIEQYRAKGGQFAFDSNYRPKLWHSRAEAQQAVERAWLLADIALPSLDDEMPLFGDPDERSVLKRIRGYGNRTGALKRGELGPVPIIEQVGGLPDFAIASEVVDTTAAGDSFNGAFIASILTDNNLSDALIAGHNCALKVIAHRGAIIPNI